MATQAELELVISMRDRAQSQLKGLQSQLAGLTRTVQQLGHAFGGSGAFVAGAGVGGLAAAAAGIGLAFDSTKEQAQLAFETIYGSSAKATDLIDRLQTSAKELPFTFTDVLRSGQRLAAAGFDPEGVQRQMTIISDAISATGDISSEKLDMITGAFVRMRSTGVFSMEPIEALNAAGINITKALADQAGISEFAESRVLQHMSGRVAAGPMMDKINEALAARFHGLSAKQADTMAGVLNNIKDLIQQRLGDVMLPIFQRTELLLRRIFYYLDQTRETFKKLPEPVKNAVKDWAAFLLVAAPIALVLSAIVTTISTVVGAFGAVAGAAESVAGVLALIDPIVAIIAIALVTLYLAWTNNWFGIRDALTAVWGVIQPILQAIWDFVVGLATGKINLAVAVSTAFDAGWEWVKWLAGQVGKTIKSAWSATMDLLGDAWDWITWLGGLVGGAAAFAFTSTLSLLAGGWTYLAWAADNIGKSLNWDSAVSLLKGGWDYVAWAADNLGKILSYDSMVRLLSGGWDWITWAADNLGKTLDYDSLVNLLGGGWDWIVWAADNLGKILTYDSAVSLLEGGWTYLRWAADNIGKVLNWDSAVSLLRGGWDYVKWMADQLGKILHFDLTLNIGWVNEWVHKILDWIVQTGGRIVNVGGGLLGGQSALVAGAPVLSSAATLASAAYTINFNAPVYANDIEDMVVRALDEATRKGRT